MPEAPPRWLLRVLDPSALEAIRQAIAAAEADTSGEIRVHLEPLCPGDPLGRARVVFTALGMHRTAGRNGVLIYVSIEDRKLAVVGDVGVDALVPSTFWTRLCANLATHLRAGRSAEGLVAAVREAGEALRAGFPRAPDDRNELPDDLSAGEPG
jgi:uncharacterized membrane protein